MLIKDLIKELQEIYDKESRWENWGEPEIMIDVFDTDGNGRLEYLGFDKIIAIEKSGDGVYNILSRFK